MLNINYYLGTEGGVCSLWFLLGVWQLKINILVVNAIKQATRNRVIIGHQMSFSEFCEFLMSCHFFYCFGGFSSPSFEQNQFKFCCALVLLLLTSAKFPVYEKICSRYFFSKLSKLFVWFIAIVVHLKMLVS